MCAGVASEPHGTLLDRGYRKLAKVFRRLVIGRRTGYRDFGINATPLSFVRRFLLAVGLFPVAACLLSVS
jgi:hypothetical protein